MRQSHVKDGATPASRSQRTSPERTVGEVLCPVRWHRHQPAASKGVPLSPPWPRRMSAGRGSRQAACPAQSDRRPTMNSGTTVNAGLDLSAQTVGAVTVAEVTGELDIASAPALREQLLSLLRPGSSRLVIDLSKVSFCDASGLAVLVNTGRRARLLGGFLRLAAVSPQVGQVLNITRLHRHLPSSPPAPSPPVAPAATRRRLALNPAPRVVPTWRGQAQKPQPPAGEPSPGLARAR